MNLKHLGDALDGWKNWAFRALLPEGFSLVVVPMFTDAQAWTEDHLALYKRMIGANVEIVLAGRTFSNANRGEYFDEAATQVERYKYIFVDPDNGPWTGTATRNRDRYVKADELVRLLPDGNENDTVVIVYRHEDRSQDIQGLQSYISRLLHNRGVHAFGILCGVTSLLCISRRRNGRLADSRNRIVTHLAPIAECRVTEVVPVNG